MKILYVDDESLPRRWYDEQNLIQRATTYEEAINKIQKDKFDIIDIKLEIKGASNGCDIIRYIIKEQLEVPYIYIHSKDAEMRSQMIKLLKNFTKSQIQYYENN